MQGKIISGFSVSLFSAAELCQRGHNHTHARAAPEHLNEQTYEDLGALKHGSIHHYRHDGLGERAEVPHLKERGCL